MTDAGPPRELDPARQPMFNLPGVISASCVVLVALYGLYAFAAIETQVWAIAHFAFVPARMAIALDVARPALRAAVQHVPQETFSALIGAGGGRWWSLVTHALMHGSFAHVGLNCVWLVVFGSPVARRFGAARFLLLALVAVLAGALSLFLWDPASFAPAVGASAGVAGMAGAAVRFVFGPAARGAAMPHSLRDGTAFRQPALTLAQTFGNRAGLLFIVLFLGSEIVTGLVPEVSGVNDMPIAWQGHVGGFLAGLLLFPLLDPRRPPHEKDARLPLAGQSPR